MDNVDEARDLIRNIRLAKRADEADGADENANDVQQALRILSEELYSKPTHFILELIQNADDNRYRDNVTPQLTIIYRHDGFLWIGCNEIGFTPANVRAICRIGDSTKKVEGSRRGYIGEKGIGFKSVFKVADVVWISSGALQFQYDKTKPLGMIAPQWCDFNANALVNERTRFCFRIPEAEHREIIRNDLLGLKPELLLFLRQLRVIEIKIQDQFGVLEESYRVDRNDEDVPRLQGTAENMPDEPKRQNVSESEVLIGFPVSVDFEPRITNHLTFNFLPIRAYGLPFVLQGDFLLSASREDVLQDNAWNQAVISAATELFVDSVRYFNAKNLLKYSWPRYLASQGNAFGTAFHDFLDRLVSRLRSEAVIESRQCTMENPSDVKYVHSVFTDGATPPKPLLSGIKSYVAASYSFNDLSKLRIQEQSGHAFLDLLRDYVTTQPDNFRRQAAQWHSRVARAISSTGSYSVRDLRLVPLRNGHWISASGTDFYFPDISDGVALPIGIEVDIIDDDAARDPARRSFFSELGARSLNSAEVYHLILDQHRNHGRSYGAWTVESVVAHAWFLFTSPSKPTYCDTSRLHLAAHNSDFLQPGRDLYMDVPGNTFQISDYFGSEATVIHYIHGQYLTQAPANDVSRWFNWLQTELGLRTMPRLASSGNISPEFDWIIHCRFSDDWLLLLKDQWAFYSDELHSPSNFRLRSNLSRTPVICSDGHMRELKNIYLATPSVLGEPFARANVPMLAVDDPNDAGWRPFSLLELRTSPDLQFYLTILERIQSGRSQGFTLDDVKRMYKGISEYFNDDRELVRNAFATKGLIYVASPKPGKWLRIDECRWTAPSSLRSFTRVSGRYPDLSGLFVDQLGLKSATASDVVRELQDLSGNDGEIEWIKELLKTLNTSVGGRSADDIIKTLYNNTLKILPVRSNGSSLRSCTDIDWFIADRTSLEECFKDKVALLDFERIAIAQLRPLLEKLALQQRFLSANFTENTKAEGESTFHQAFTDHLRSKASFISRLVDTSRYHDVIDQLLTAEVWCTTALTLRRYVTVNGERIYGKDDQGWIVLQENDGSIFVYVAKEAVLTNKLPPKPLVDSLMAHLDISKDREILLFAVLTMDVTTFLDDLLEKANIGDGALVPGEKQDTDPDSYLDFEVDTAGTSQHIESSSNLVNKSHSFSTAQGNGQLSPAVFLGRQRKTPRRTKTRAYVGEGVRCSVFDLSAIMAAATAWDVSRVDVVAESSLQHNTGIIFEEQAAGLSGEDSSPGDRQAVVSTIGILRDLTTNGSGQSSGHAFDISGMESALNSTTASADNMFVAASMRTTSSRNVIRLPISMQAPITGFQEECGYCGEVFIHNILKSQFGAGDDCWTSDMRSRYGLSPFAGEEIEHSDFTITDPAVAERITNWLIDAGNTFAEGLHDTQVTYHFEVNSTVGRRDEPFSMSNNQVRLARRWHASRRDVYAVFRVYNLASSPTFCAYVDPLRLMLAGKLSFTAQGGYYVQPR
ncbi:hypothetical protein LTR37_015917 [Vermiconidia calcicola]|uniref:Uncharacterized protein n=1 Tax=Vermiconidia calcicola TaxID=1690605 RepID=A0ACC3MPD1_9PEZI|nr:hypothetical protein LTR37_015917 [Vermiconidia calcicola]